MSDILKHPLVLLLVGLAFSAGFVPWEAKRWQNRQRELETKTSLVAEMSECVMKFVAELEYCLPLAQAVEARPTTDASSSLSLFSRHRFHGHDAAGVNEVLKRIYREFDVCRCVIGTKLEVYYPGVSSKESIHQDWQILAESLIELYKLDSSDGACAEFTDRLRTTLVKLAEPEKFRAAARAEERKHVVDARWGKPEQLLLAEKHRIITEVLATDVEGIQ